MKGQIRILAIDDGSFSFDDDSTPVVGVAMRLPGYIEGVMVGELEIDGNDATDVLIGMLSGSRYLEQVKLILLDGAALGGFNVVDVNQLYDELAIPIATVTRDRPDYDEIEKALKKHFDDWQARLDLMKSVPLEEFDTGHTPIFVGRVGIEKEQLAGILQASIVQGALPEALRVAHLVATAISKGESRGRA